jgi:hypothetical protein
MTVLDQILASVDWDANHPLAKVSILPKGVSDHNSLVIIFGEKLQIRNPFLDLRSGGLKWMESLTLLRIFGKLNSQ